MNNTESFNNTSNYKLKKTSKVGIMILSLVVAGAVVTTSINQMKKDNTPRDVIEEIIPQFSTNTTLEEINNMNIIINDSDCSDSFFEDVCSYLSSYGLKFDITRNCIDINEEDCTVITIDQQYNSGYGSLIFAPFNNARLGYSDSLALAMKAAMEKNQIIVDDIMSGKVGFRKDENGEVSTLVPTESEEKIESDRNTSFVTISLGTQNTSAEVISRSILDALIRQKYYLEHYDSQTDLLYRANTGEDIDIIANYFSSSVADLLEVNELSDVNILEAQTIANPNVKGMVSFNSEYSFSLGEEKSKTI